MNKRTCYLLFVLTFNVQAQEHKSTSTKKHHHHVSDININIHSPNDYNDLVEEHKVALKKTKIKVGAVTAVATALIAGAVALLIHYTTSGCAT